MYNILMRIASFEMLKLDGFAFFVLKAGVVRGERDALLVVVRYFVKCYKCKFGFICHRYDAFLLSNI